MSYTKDSNPRSTTHPDIARPDWLPEAQWPFALRRFRLCPDDPTPGAGAGLDVHYTDEGRGPTLVFVHAGMWSFIWRDTVAALRSDFRCIALDFPGTGLSGGTKADINIASYPDIVNGLLDHLKVERATLVVHDLGGGVGVAAAGDRPERVEGLVATNSFAWPPGTRALRVMLSIMGSRPVTATMGTARIIPRMTSTRFGVGRHFGRADRQSFLGPYRSRALSRNFHRTMRSAAAAGGLFEQAEVALTDSLQGLPLLTVFGENNDQFGFADTWQTHFPYAQRSSMAGGNHFPMCDDPEAYVSLLRSWHQSRVATRAA